ncbi:sugar ABC transporter permease [Clostridia bacterium]|nr:sugar ABC transporter permease [Clostridia bacterium]
MQKADRLSTTHRDLRQSPKGGIKRKCCRFGKSILDRWQLYVFLILPLAYLIIFAYVPMLGLQLAFKKFQISKGIWGSPWAGLAQFRKFFSSYMFSRLITNTVRISLYSLIAGFPLPILFALALNSVLHRGYKKAIQMITYMPYFISTVVLVGMLLRIINPRIGIYGVVYNFFTGREAPNLIGIPGAFPHLYVWSGIWQSLGYSSIIYLAGLASVDQELHEAAQIDGADRFRRVLHIDLPGILPTAVILLIMSAGSIMNVGFEKAYLMRNDLNQRTSEVIATFIYRQTLAASSGVQDFSYGTAIGLFNSAINLVLILFVNTVAKKASGESLF